LYVFDILTKTFNIRKLSETEFIELSPEIRQGVRTRTAAGNGDHVEAQIPAVDDREKEMHTKTPKNQKLYKNRLN
jgi:hypothetical protein